MAAIRLINLRKQHGAQEVLRGINLEIRDGEFMVLVGPSGCAKSTTLRLISGLEKATAGEIRVDDKIVNDLPPKDRNVAMVFQSYALFPNMTVRGNLSFGMETRGESKEKIKAEVGRVAELLGLTNLLERKPRALSGGQAQRVALGRAIIRHPDAYLFDEPLSNLDAELRQQMRAEISALQKRLGVTTVYVTHDQVEAMTMGDRIAVMRDGNIIQTGAPADLYADPDNAFVAGFLGSPKINFFPVDGQTEPGNIILNYLDNPTAYSMLAGVRAEHLQIRQPPRDGEILFDAEVERWERLGHETLLWLKPRGTKKGGEHSCFSARVESGGERGLQRGQMISASFSPRDILLFEAENGARIRNSRFTGLQ